MSWDKIWLLEGCPYFIEWFIEDLREDLGNPNVIKFDSNTNSAEFKSAVEAFPFYDVPDLIIVNNPDAEILNSCISCLNSMRCSSIIFVVDYNTFDGRQSFVSKAIKNKRLKTFDFYEQGEDLSRFMNTWSKRINFSK